MLFKKLSVLLILAAIICGLNVFTGCDIVTGSGETSTFEMDYTDFTRLEISTGFDVVVTQEDSYYLSITVDKSLYEYLTVAQRGDTLLVGLKTNYTYTAATRQAIINLPDLRRLQLSGGAKATLDKFSVEHAIDFELSGVSSLLLNPTVAGDASFIISGGSTVTGTLHMNNGQFKLDGTSKVDISGTAVAIKLDASGGSKVILDKVPVTTANVKLSGASDAVINVSDIMDIDLSGGSSLEYIGSPKLGGMKMSGGSILNQRQ